MPYTGSEAQENKTRLKNDFPEGKFLPVAFVLLADCRSLGLSQREASQKR